MTDPRPHSSRRGTKAVNALLTSLTTEREPPGFKRSTHAQPTISALVKATNKLNLYPEFQDLRRVVAGLQVENLKTLVAEEQSHVAINSMGKKYGELQRALGELRPIERVRRNRVHAHVYVSPTCVLAHRIESLLPPRPLCRYGCR